MPALGITAPAAIDHLTNWGTVYRWVQLHAGHPGNDGTSNVAVETDRVQADWGTPVLAGSGLVVEMTHTDILDWLTVAASEDYQHCSWWTASTAGTCGGTGIITAEPIVVGNSFTLPAGAIIVSQPVAAD